MYTKCVCVCVRMLFNLRGFNISPHDWRLRTDAVHNGPVVYFASKCLQLWLADPNGASLNSCASRPAVCAKSCVEALVPGEGAVFSTCTPGEGDAPRTQSILGANGVIVRQEWVMPNKA